MPSVADEPFDIEVAFEPADEVGESEAAELMASLREVGADAAILERHPANPVLPALAIVAIVGASMSTVAGLAVTVVFLYKAFKRGVTIDLRGDKPRVTKNENLPLGSILFLYADGRQEYREAVSTSDVTAALRDAIASGGAGAG